MLPTPTSPIIPPDDEEGKEESVRPMDWLFSSDFYMRRFMRVY